MVGDKEDENLGGETQEGRRPFSLSEGVFGPPLLVAVGLPHHRYYCSTRPVADEMPILENVERVAVGRPGRDEEEPDWQRRTNRWCLRRRTRATTILPGRLSCGAITIVESVGKVVIGWEAAEPDDS
jgi:hypothetical protein